MRTGVGNVLGNPAIPWVAPNNLLQGKVPRAWPFTRLRAQFHRAWPADVAGEAGLPKHDEDLGRRLGAGACGRLAPSMLPFGPRTPGDAAAPPADMMANEPSGRSCGDARNTVPGTRCAPPPTLLGADRR